MAQGDRIFYASNSYLNDRIVAEATTRTNADNTIQTNINTTKSILSGTQVTAAGLSADISNENAIMLAQAGSMNFGGLTWNDSGTPRVPETLTKAINALNTLSLANNTSISTAGGQDMIDSATYASKAALLSMTNNDKLQAILALSTEDMNSFSELLNLVNNNDIAIASLLSSAQADIDAVVNTKTTQLQTINTTMYYVDKTTSIKYKLAMSNGNLVLIEL